MSSSRKFDFRLRTNKSIERAIAFDVLRDLREFLADDLVYVGLGSLWFVDFRMAHRLLGIETMISIESDPEVAARAEFNKPYKSVQIIEGMTTAVVPELITRPDIEGRPWLVWLDYDSFLTEDRVQELERLVVDLPDGSAVITTFNAVSSNYGKFDHRLEALGDLFGSDIVGTDLTPEDVNKGNFGPVLARCVSQYMEAVAIRARRPGGFVPSISLRYSDSNPMITIGGLLPGAEAAANCVERVAAPNWIGRDEMVIEVEPLTMREVDALCQLLPAVDKLKSSDVAMLGFELPDAQIEFFERHYFRYPSYAEIVS